MPSQGQIVSTSKPAIPLGIGERKVAEKSVAVVDLLRALAAW